MTVGLSVTNVANAWLNELSTLAPFAKLHTGDPGASGANNASSVTTRMAITWPGASGGSHSMTGSISWTAWAGSTETVSHLSTWSASTAGNFAFSVAFSASRAVAPGDTLTVTTLSVSQAPLAA